MTDMPSTDTPIKDVSDTAFMVAMYRAKEGERPDALFRDPLALKLAGERGKRVVTELHDDSQDWTKARPARVMIWHMALRTYIIDRFISTAIAQGVDLVLNLGAGLDTRPYRMVLPQGLHWIEVDYPHVIELKNSELATEKPRCNLERIKLDLADRAARQALFSSLSARFSNVLVLTEGVVLYLTEHDAGELADDLRAQSSFKRWIVDYFSRQAIEYRERSLSDKLHNTPFQFKPSDYFGFFQQRRWRVKEICYLGDEAIKLSRPMPLPPLAAFWLKVMRPFISEEQRATVRKLMAYVVFEPS